MKHRVVINVSKSNKKAPVLKAAQLTLPRRILKWLFGDFTQVYLLKPGETIQSVDVKEIEKGEDKYE
mgnify:FL=1